MIKRLLSMALIISILAPLNTLFAEENENSVEEIRQALMDAAGQSTLTPKPTFYTNTTGYDDARVLANTIVNPKKPSVLKAFENRDQNSIKFVYTERSKYVILISFIEKGFRKTNNETLWILYRTPQDTDKWMSEYFNLANRDMLNAPGTRDTANQMPSERDIQLHLQKYCVDPMTFGISSDGRTDTRKTLATAIIRDGYYSFGLDHPIGKAQNKITNIELCSSPNSAPFVNTLNFIVSDISYVLYCRSGTEWYKTIFVLSAVFP